MTLFIDPFVSFTLFLFFLALLLLVLGSILLYRFLKRRVGIADSDN